MLIGVCENDQNPVVCGKRCNAVNLENEKRNRIMNALPMRV